MSRAAILYFTERGGRLGQELAGFLGCEALKPARGELLPLTARLFREVDALIFIGACGVAVRAIAPLVRDKTSDPAVLVLDEAGRFVIPLLSGHIGGANALARRVAAHTGGAAVITTATDVNGRFAADAWAAANGCAIDSLETARAFAAAILREDLPLTCDFPIRGDLPNGVYLGEEGALGAAITVRRDARPFDTTLRLIPRILCVGVGCKRGTSAEAIAGAVDRALELGGLDPRAVRAVATIDVKRDEPGLVAWCAARGLPLRCHTAAELGALEGDFASSDFVLKTVGVDNVCERAAVLSAGAGAEIVVRKQAANGVTVAVARQDWRASFE